MGAIPEIPGYELKSRLGAGGMGVVYFATRKDNDYQYAIKMLLLGRDASLDELARFRIEAEAYACLNHPNIVKIRDVGVVSGCPFLAMDFVEHGCLSEYIADLPSLDIPWCLKTIKSVADALAHAHGRRILHRDLKPANVLIASDGSPRVTDFGLVKFCAPLSAVSQSCCTFQVNELDEHLVRMANENKHFLPVAESGDVIETLARTCADRSELATDFFDLAAIATFVHRSMETRETSDELSPVLDEMTRRGSVLGSPQFMSPEQAEGRIEDIGPHTDVYGLGATFYHVVTGQAPVSGSNLLEIVRNVSTRQPIPPDAINTSVPEDVSLVIMKALDKTPSHRYANMEMFAEDLERVLEGRAPLARLDAGRNKRHSSGGSLLRRMASSLSTLIPNRNSTSINARTTVDSNSPGEADESKPN